MIASKRVCFEFHHPHLSLPIITYLNFAFRVAPDCRVPDQTCIHAVLPRYLFRYCSCALVPPGFHRKDMCDFFVYRFAPMTIACTILWRCTNRFRRLSGQPCVQLVGQSIAVLNCAVRMRETAIVVTSSLELTESSSPPIGPDVRPKAQLRTLHVRYLRASHATRPMAVRLAC